MQKKGRQSKRIHIKLTLNVKITLNINCYYQQNEEKCTPQHYHYSERTFRKWHYFCLNGLFLRSKNVNFTKTYFF